MSFFDQSKIYITHFYEPIIGLYAHENRKSHLKILLGGNVSMKRISKGWISALAMLCAAVMVFTLTSCSSSNGAAAKTKSTKFENDLTSGSEVDLTFWHAMGGVNGAALTSIVNDFNTKYAGLIKVTPQYQGSYDDEVNKLKTAETSNAGPNVAQVYELGTRFMIDSGWIIPVQDAIDASSWDVKQLEPNLAAYYTVNKKLYGMPFNSSTPLLYYNKDAFKAAGLDPNTPPKTFAQIIDYSKKISASNPNMGGIGMYTYGWWMDQNNDNLAVPMYNNGNGRTKNPTKVVGDSNGSIKKFLTAYKELFTSGAAPAYAATATNCQSAFIAGKLAMEVESTAGLKTFLTGVNGKFEIGCGFYPTVNSTAKTGVSIGGAALYMFKNSDSRVQQAEWMFLKYMTSASVQATWNAKTGYFPVNVNAQKEQTFKDNVAKYPQFQVALDQLHQSTPANCGFLVTIGTQARKIEETDMQKVINNQMGVDDAVKDISAQINSSLSDYNAANS